MASREDYDARRMLQQYAVTALWSSLGDDDEPLDAQFDEFDLADSARDEMVSDLAGFLDLIEEARPTVWDEMEATLWVDPGQVAHDFWLTRNHHGAGFWDRYSGGHPAAELGDYLTKCAESYGSCDLYAGDDGKLYVM